MSQPNLNVAQQLKIIYNRLRGKIKSSVGPSFDMDSLDKCVRALEHEYYQISLQEQKLSEHLLRLAASPNISKDEAREIMLLLGYDKR